MNKFILLLLLCAGFTASAQKGKIHSGLLVTINGDTLKGLIQYKKNPGINDSLYFRESSKGEMTSYAWSALKYFGTPGEDDHIVCTVYRTLEYIDPLTYNIMLKDSVITEAIPLTAVYSGKHLSLYKFSWPSDYYFLSNGEKTIQLVQTYRYLTLNEQRFYIDRVPRYFINCIFRNQLAEFYDFEHDSKLDNLRGITDYKEDQLKTLISKMDKKTK